MRRFRFTIRSLMIVTVVAGLVAWVARQVDSEALRLLRGFGELVAVEILPLAGMAWSVSGAYRNPPGRQGRPIAGLILSTLGLVFAPLAYAYLAGWG